MQFILNRLYCNILSRFHIPVQVDKFHRLILPVPTQINNSHFDRSNFAGSILSFDV